MKASNGKLRLVLRSKKVVARVEQVETGSISSNSLMTWNGQLFVSRRRVAIYDYVLDERQMRALCEARELARSAGLALEVIDLSRQGALRRILRLGLSRSGGEEAVSRYRLSSEPLRGSSEVHEKRGAVSSPASPP